ncbi:hypothetical protein DPMN_003987 [Dreissena polymorpha]|uniref:Uncharacterized protein n=1 Tax=Dreissena polymorpha TaxID=45954 RepID=A0A9D4MPZ0_DREPO|nr:hypothetical protein DPMN_003987 [Dreissena polymorpha]
MAAGEPGRSGLSANVTDFVGDIANVTARLPKMADMIVRIRSDTKWKCAITQSIVQLTVAGVLGKAGPSATVADFVRDIASVIVRLP